MDGNSIWRALNVEIYAGNKMGYFGVIFRRYIVYFTSTQVKETCCYFSDKKRCKHKT